jgi:hypothetical protein
MLVASWIGSIILFFACIALYNTFYKMLCPDIYMSTYICELCFKAFIVFSIIYSVLFVIAFFIALSVMDLPLIDTFTHTMVDILLWVLGLIAICFVLLYMLIPVYAYDTICENHMPQKK